MCKTTYINFARVKTMHDKAVSSRQSGAIEEYTPAYDSKPPPGQAEFVGLWH